VQQIFALNFSYLEGASIYSAAYSINYALIFFIACSINIALTTLILLIV